MKKLAYLALLVGLVASISPAAMAAVPHKHVKKAHHPHHAVHHPIHKAHHKKHK